jgi:hypothetical protein
MELAGLEVQGRFVERKQWNYERYKVLLRRQCTKLEAEISF